MTPNQLRIYKAYYKNDDIAILEIIPEKYFSYFIWSVDDFDDNDFNDFNDFEENLNPYVLTYLAYNRISKNDKLLFRKILQKSP